MSSQEVNFAAVKQAVAMEVVFGITRLTICKAATTVGIAGGVPSTRARGAMPFTST